MSIQDQWAIAKSRIIDSYKEATNLNEYIRALIQNESSELETMFDQLLTLTNLNTATGVNLEVLGVIVGQSRQVGDTIYGDEDYRLLIRGRIANNFTSSTPEELIVAVQFILTVENVQIIEGPASVSVGIGRPLTATEIDLVTNRGLIPKTLGVNYDYFSYKSDGSFAYRSVVSGGVVPNSKGYGTVSNAAFGGPYSSIFA